MEGPDHLLELQHLRAAVPDAGVGGFGSEEADRIVPPVVLEPLARVRIDPRHVALVELLDRHQLHRGHAELLQVRYLLDQAAIRPGKADLGAGMDGVAAHVKLIDDGRFPGMAERLVALPVEIRVSDDALRRGGRVIDLGQGQVLLGRRRIVAEGRAKVTPGDSAIAVAYGSTTSLSGLKRCPSWGAYGPATRYP